MINKRQTFIYIVVSVIVILILFFIYYFRQKVIQIIIPFFIAVIIVYLINPIVLKLEKRNISKTVSILMIYLFFGIAITTLAIFIVPEMVKNTKDLMTTLPQISLQYQSIFKGVMSFIKSSNWPDDIKTAIYKEIGNGAAIAQNLIMSTLKKSLLTLFETVTMIFDFGVALVIAYYFIKDGEYFKRSVLSLTPRRWRNGMIGAGRDIHKILSKFIQGQLLTALIVGIMEVIGLFIIRVKYPLVLGCIGGIANIIPYFGPIIGVIPAVAIALIDSPMKVLWTFLVFAIVQQIDNSFISPKIIEGGLGLHPVATILVVLIGGEFFGILGMLMAVPVAAILKALAKRAVEAIV